MAGINAYRQMNSHILYKDMFELSDQHTTAVILENPSGFPKPRL